MILVIGGRSKIGTALIAELLDRGQQVRALVRAGEGLYQDYRRSGTGGYAAQVTDTAERLTGRPGRSLDELLGEIPVQATHRGQTGT